MKLVTTSKVPDQVARYASEIATREFLRPSAVIHEGCSNTKSRNLVAATGPSKPRARRGAGAHNEKPRVTLWQACAGPFSKSTQASNTQ